MQAGRESELHRLEQKAMLRHPNVVRTTMAAEMSWKEGKTVNIADVKSSKTNGYASWVQCTQVEHLSVGTVSVKRQCLIKESHARKKRVPNLFIERKRVSDAVSTDSYIVSCLPTSLFWLESHHVGVCLCPVVAFKVQEVLQRAQLSPKTYAKHQISEQKKCCFFAGDAGSLYHR